MRLLAVAAVLALALAGCGEEAGGEAPPQPSGGGLPMLHGYVFDPAVRPLAGVTVKVLETNATVATDANGFFGFDDLPIEQFLVVVASLPGFVSGSKQVTLTPEGPVRLNFTLAPVPVEVPYHSVEKHEMLVECQLGFVLNDENETFGCGSGARNTDTWEIAVAERLSGAVIEVYWEPATMAAESMGARLETLDLGQFNLVLSEVVGTSPLRLSVPQATAERYYVSGGLMRLSVYAAPNADENEAGAGASLHVEQAITAYASLFYVAPPDPAYTIQNAS